MNLTPPASQHDQVIRILRAAILGGQYPIGGRLPGTVGLAADMRLSPSVIQRAFAALEAEGLVRAERGRGTTVRPWAVYQAEARIRWAGGEAIPDGVLRAAAALAATAENEDAAVDWADVLTEGRTIVVMATVRAADAGHAGNITVGLVRVIAAGDDRWDLAGATISAEPASTS